MANEQLSNLKTLLASAASLVDGLLAAQAAVTPDPQTPPVVAPPAPPIVTPPATTTSYTKDGIELIPSSDPEMCPAWAVQPTGFSLTSWPRVVRTDGVGFGGSGVNYQTRGPLNRKFRSGMTAYIFGHQPGTFVFDGSNGHEGKPAQPGYTAKGWPLRYTFDQNGAVIGTPTIWDGENAFNTEDELYAWAAAEEARRTAQAGPQPTTTRRELYNSYPSKQALLDDIVATAFGYAVLLDNVPIHDGFGPADSFVSQHDGSVVKGAYVAPVSNPPVPPMPTRTSLYDSYPSKQALLDDIALLRFSYVVLLDNVPLNEGFGPPDSFVTQADGSVVKGTYHQPVDPPTDGGEDPVEIQ